MGNSMAVILKNVIKSGGMPLTQVSERIETMYLSGRISGEERTELTELMHEKANPENEKGSHEELYRTLVEKYNDLLERVSAIEAQLKNEGDVEEPDENEDVEYPVWEPWDGVSAGYQYGDIITHNGQKWQNMLQGAANVWEPGALGVDERYWKEI